MCQFHVSSEAKCALSIELSCLTIRCLTHLPCILASAFLVILCEVDFGILMQGKETACGVVGNLYYEIGCVGTLLPTYV